MVSKLYTKYKGFLHWLKDERLSYKPQKPNNIVSSAVNRKGPDLFHLVKPIQRWKAPTHLEPKRIQRWFWGSNIRVWQRLESSTNVYEDLFEATRKYLSKACRFRFYTCNLRMPHVKLRFVVLNVKVECRSWNATETFLNNIIQIQRILTQLKFPLKHLGGSEN